MLSKSMGIRTDFSKNLSDFLNLKSDTIKNQGIIDLSSCNIKSYANVVLSDSEVAK